MFPIYKKFEFKDKKEFNWFFSNSFFFLCNFPLSPTSTKFTQSPSIYNKHKKTFRNNKKRFFVTCHQILNRVSFLCVKANTHVHSTPNQNNMQKNFLARCTYNNFCASAWYINRLQVVILNTHSHVGTWTEIKKEKTSTQICATAKRKNFHNLYYALIHKSTCTCGIAKFLHGRMNESFQKHFLLNCYTQIASSRIHTHVCTQCSFLLYNHV